MAEVNPWSAGAVVFDNRPWLAFFERQSVRQQAKEDALDNYFRDLGKNVTSAGMRSQDVPVLLQKTKDWQNFYSQNKQAILNPKMDNGRAYTEYDNRYRDQLALMNESKSEAKKDQELGKLRFNAEAKHIFDDPDFIKEKELDNLPIGDPRRKRFDLMTAALPPKPIETKDLEALNNYLTGGVLHDKVPGKTENIGGFKTRTPIYTQYNTEQQLAIGGHAMDIYDTDKRWRMEAVKQFKELQGDPVRYAQLNNVYKSLYGNDIDSPREAWVAKGIFDNNMKATEYTEGKDEIGLWNYKQKIQQANAKELIKYKKDIDPNDTDLNNTWVESYLSKSIGEAKADPNKYRVIYGGQGFGGKGFEIDASPVLMKAFSRNNTEPDRIYVTEDNKILPIFYKYGSPKDEKGNVIAGREKEVVLQTNKAGHPLVDEDYSRPMSIDHAKLALGYKGQTKKQLSETMSAKSGATHPLPSGQPRTVKQGGYTYTWNDQTGKYE